jgi:D-glycero-D-manno-heptose 1,7-bisphosphate phosphatase
MRPAAFFDRDGVLNQDHGYVYQPEEWDWNEGARKTLEELRRLGYAIVVVSNQSGIGRGFYTADHVTRLHRQVLEELVDGIYFCPHLPDSDCECRKPRPGMIEQAIRELDLDRARSFLIGDNDWDIAAAEAAGMPGYLYQGGDLWEFTRRTVLGATAER